MKQKDVMALLVEAARPDCDNARRNAICVQLTHACASRLPDGSHEIDTPASGLNALLGMLFMSAITHSPESLPMLFPAFAAICGDRADDALYANVDWSVTNKKTYVVTADTGRGKNRIITKWFGIEADNERSARDLIIHDFGNDYPPGTAWRVEEETDTEEKTER